MTDARRPAGLLAAIVAGTRTVVAERRSRVPLSALWKLADGREPRAARFRAALSRPDAVNILAECKRRSPARGVLSRNYRPAAIARAYEQGGAAAISVLTEPMFFDGSLAHLEAVRSAVDLPVLRKDFIVDDYQLVEARAAGADAVLLIAAALTQPALNALAARADELGLATIVEVHSADELERAVQSGARVVGINSRDRAAGFRAFLVGERLMTAANPAAMLGELSGRGTDARSEQTEGA
ncbi:MAG: indole-3-glycerol phosphate synthase TrpC [Acidobacteria bacterium]|nr:indole-3-glycerol phosphate synthase TrpC [Acidobacteriota bacterium]